MTLATRTIWTMEEASAKHTAAPRRNRTAQSSSLRATPIQARRDRAFETASGRPEALKRRAKRGPARSSAPPDLQPSQRRRISFGRRKQTRTFPKKTLAIRSALKAMTPAGLEPAIPGSVGRCLIHWATGPCDIRQPINSNSSKASCGSFNCERLGPGSAVRPLRPRRALFPTSRVCEQRHGHAHALGGTGGGRGGASNGCHRCCCSCLVG